MPGRQRHTPGRAIARPRGAEAKLAKGAAIARVRKDLAVTERTCDRWRKEDGGLELDQAERLKDPEKGNARLKRPPAEAELDEAILREAASGRP